MNEREMTDVKEVLDDARPACLHAVGPRNQHPICRIVEQLEPWDPARAAAETHPYDVMRRRREKGAYARLCRRDLLRGCGREHAPPLPSICPTGIPALQPYPAHDPAQRQSSASMHPQGAPPQE